MNIYAIGCGEFIKIGISGDVGSRLASLQTGSPHLLSVLHQEPIDPERAVTIERHAHWLLRQQHERGEWFRADVQSVRRAIAVGIAEAVEVKAPVGLVLGKRRGTLEYEEQQWLLESASEPQSARASDEWSDEEDGSL